MKRLLKTSTVIRRVLILSVLLSAFVLFVGARTGTAPVQASALDAPESCTSIMVGRLASTDGSVMTSHTCDGNYRTWLNIVPAGKPGDGARTKVYAGLLHTETPQDAQGVAEKGEVPQAAETFAYLNTAYPCLNEHQLAIGESTIGGRRDLRNPDGKLYIEEVERLMLQRCRTAREAIKLAGALVKEFGYGDDGECITIADPKEVWHFEIFGAGLGQPGAVWAAVRIPDDEVGVAANIPRISTLDLKNPDRFLASDNVLSLAEQKKWWDPRSGEPFKFWKAYGGDKPFSTREYYILSTLAPSLNLKIDAEELPFSVKPQKKLSPRDLLRYFRETYAGTDLDATKNLMVKGRGSDQLLKSPVASPWMSRDLITLLNTIKPGVVDAKRPIAIAGCSYATVLQCRSWLPDQVGGLCWFAFDNPALSPRIPIFAGVKELPAGFENCAQHRYRTDSACWFFRRANRLATVRWGAAQPYIEAARTELEDKAFGELPDVERKAMEILKSKDGGPEACAKFLTSYSGDFARAAMRKYWELGDTFWGMFARGF
jgi:dipeptidase